jgi:hypothetical protein
LDRFELRAMPSWNRLAAIPDGERTFLFPLELFDEVAELVRPKRRPRLTPE